MYITLYAISNGVDNVLCIIYFLKIKNQIKIVKHEGQNCLLIKPKVVNSQAQYENGIAQRFGQKMALH